MYVNYMVLQILVIRW